MSEFIHTVQACSDDMLARTKNNWSIADAILADIPDDNATRVAYSLSQLAESLDELGVTNHRDELYTADSLRHLRNTAMYWPEPTRHIEASFRTHQEASTPDSQKGVALAALCAVARGESVKCPDGLDPASFDEAVNRVMETRGRFKVSVNTLRVALSRKVNVPQPMPTTTIEMLKLVSDMKAGARHFAKAYGGTDPDISDDEKTGLTRALGDLIETLRGLISVVQGLTIEDLEELGDMS